MIGILISGHLLVMASDGVALAIASVSRGALNRAIIDRFVFWFGPV